ncbi:sensor domain-containing protein [Robertmurraya sp. Marseille-Q9965]
MKYIGRISSIIPILAINIWLLKHTATYDGVPYFLSSLILVIVASIISWTLGGQFDKARYYYHELQKEKENLQQIFDSVEVTIWSNNIVEQRIHVSKGVEKVSGYSVTRFFDDYTFWMKIFLPEDQQKLDKFYKRVLSGKSDDVEARFIHANGEIHWAYVSGTPIFDKENKVIKINGIVVDITSRIETVGRLKESENRYRSVVELSPNLIVIYQDEKLVYANPATTRLLGMELSELKGKSAFDFIHPTFLEKAVERSKKSSQHNKETDYIEYKIVKPNGEIALLELAGNEISYNGQSAILIVGTDVTAKKQQQERIEYMAFHDALTGLPNRYLYNDTLEDALERCRQAHHVLGVMFIDVDHFKFVNDTMGHEAGDELLKQVSKRIRENVREKDLVARPGGDEFTVLLENVHEDLVREIAQRIINAFTSPFFINNKEIFASTSIGVSLYPVDGEDKETLNSKADIAMYFAKKSGKNKYQFFKEHGDELARKLQLEQDFRSAIELNEFYLEYQPCVELKTGTVYCVEALVRWKHPILGIIPPNEFISIMEETGWIVNLGTWVLNEACRQNKEWQKLGINVKVAVNVSSIQFEAENFVNGVKQALLDHKLQAEFLEIEITESVMQNVEKSTGIIQELKELGVKISIDDFGTGYSSLSLLSSLSIGHVKIDKSFIDGIINNSNIGSVVKKMIEMGESLNFDLIAEGIEVKEQADFLIENGCRYGQGYYFSRPVSPDEIMRQLMHM